jgi:hypothetical protein
MTWTFGIYSIVVSKLFMPMTGHKILDWIKEDQYYCCVVPSYIVLLMPFIWLNWTAMKYFRHTN